MSVLTTLVFYVFLAAFTVIIAKRNTLEKTLYFLGLNAKKISLPRVLIESLALFFILIIVLTIESFILAVLSVDDSQKVAVVISGLTIPGIIIASTIGPFAEELFFRGLLQKYAGVIISSLLFALLHYAFGSITEVIGAFSASLILGYWVRYRNPLLWPAIIAHAGYNVLSIIMVTIGASP